MDQICRPAAVAEYAEEPGVESLPLLVAWQSAVESNEGFLDDVVRFTGIAQHAQGEAHAAAEIPLDDGLERVDVAQLRPIDERCIDDGRRGRGAVRQWTGHAWSLRA